MMTEPDFLLDIDMDAINSIFEDVGEIQEVPACRGVFDPRSKTYLSPMIMRSRATEDIPKALDMEVVRGVDEDLTEGDVFRRSSLLLHSPPKKVEEGKKTGPAVLDMGELKPIVALERIPLGGARGASTPLEMSQASGGNESVAIIGDMTLTREDVEQEEEGDASETSSIVFAPSKTHKRGRGVLSGSAASASVTGDEGSVAAPEERPNKKKKPGRLRTASVIEKIKTRREEKEKERQQEREDWERKRMEDPNLVIPPSTQLPGIEQVVEEMEHQPTPDLTAELMQVVRSIEKVATTSKNLKGGYVRILRQAALTVHAGTNLLARRLHERTGGSQEEVLVEMRRRNRALQLDKERLEQEVQQVLELRRELEKLRREQVDLRRRNKELEKEVSDIKARLVEGESTPSSPNGLRLTIPSPVAEGGRDPPALSGSRSAPLPPLGEVGGAFGPSYLLLQQMEGTIARIVGEVMSGLGLGGSTGSLVPPHTPAVDQPEVVTGGTLEPVGQPLSLPEDRKEDRASSQRKKKKKKGKANPPSTQPLIQVEPPIQRAADMDNPTWATVVRRKRKAGEERQPPLQRPPAAYRTLVDGRGGGPPPPPPKRVGRRAPSTAAVTITAKEGTYADVMRRARKEIGTDRLRSMGIEEMRARRGRTGAYVLEIP